MARIAIVTGGTRGIGAAISKALKQEGYRKAMDVIARKFSAEMGLSAPTEGLVVMVRGGRVAIDLGGEQVQVGQEFEIYSQDEPINNAAGEVLSYVTVKHARIRIDVPRIVDLYRQGRLKLDELITGRYRLEQINDAIASVQRGEALRNVIVF